MIYMNKMLISAFIMVLRILQVLVGLAVFLIMAGFSIGVGQSMRQSGQSIPPFGGAVVCGIGGILAVVFIGAIQQGIQKLKTPEERSAQALQRAKRFFEITKKSNPSESRAKTFREKVVIPVIQQVITQYPEMPEAAEAKQLLNELEQFGFVKTFSRDEVKCVEEDMGEMYYDCPRCKHCERVSNLGKVVYQSDLNALDNMSCTKCGHQFDAGPQVKFGRCPGFDYSQL